MKRAWGTIALAVALVLIMTILTLENNRSIDTKYEELNIETEPLEEIPPREEVKLAEPMQEKIRESFAVTPEQIAEDPSEEESEIEFTPHDEIPLDNDLQWHIETECERLGVDAAYIYALIESESTFRTGLVVKDGGGQSAGLCQINSVNWPEMEKLGLDPMNELDNITYCITLCQRYFDKYPTVNHVTTCYKAGEGGAKKLNYYLKSCDKINERTEYYSNILKGADNAEN